MDDTPSTRASLLVRLRDPRDERAWAEFLDIYTPLVHRLARQGGLQEADAADLAQEVFRRGHGDRPVRPRSGPRLVPGLALPDRGT